MALDPKDGTIRALLRYGIPITRENYLNLAFAGNPPAEIDGELAEELADILGNLLPDAPPHEN